MISKLTKKQEIKILSYIREYRSIGENCDIADQTVTEDLNKFYNMLGYNPPLYIWVDNPWEANVVISAMSSGKKFNDLDKAIDSGELIARDIIDNISNKIKITKTTHNIGNLNSYWINYLNYGHEVLGIKYDYKNYNPQILNIWTNLIKKVGFFFCWENYCIICNRPSELHFDENFELHNTNGPAVRFRRGNECDIYSIHGVSIPQFIVENPESITIDIINNEENAEVKRIMMEQMGISKYLENSNAKLIDADMTFVDYPGGEMVPRALLEDKDHRRFLVASDGSTKRVYHMQVPSNCRTCIEASDALAGKDIKDSDIIAVG